MNNTRKWFGQWAIGPFQFKLYLSHHKFRNGSRRVVVTPYIIWDKF